MEFLYPNMLYALAALIIPIIIHLFNFRRHKIVYFSNTTILKTIEQENRNTKRIKELLVLIARLLFIAALVVAFAFPYKKNNSAINNTADNLIAIYIDNSMSMQTLSEEKTLFDDSRNSALRLVESLNKSQKYVLLSNDRNPKNEYPMNKDEMIMSLNEMKVEASPTRFEDIYNSLSFIKKKNEFKSATLLAYSDFQRYALNLNDLKVDTTIQVVLFPLTSSFLNNIYIDSVWLQSPVLQKNMTNELNVRIVNETQTELKGLPVNFSLDNNVVAYTTCDIETNSYADVSMQFIVDNDGDRKAKVKINDSPITFDDEYNLVLKVRPSINVVEIFFSQQPTVNSQRSTANGQSLSSVSVSESEFNSYLELLFKDDDLIDYRSMNAYNIDNNIINNAQMIVVDENASLNETMQQMLLDFAKQGGTLLLLNDENTDNSYIYNKIGVEFSDFDENPMQVEYIADNNPFFDDIFVKIPDNADLPNVKKHIRYDYSNNVLNIISLQNGDPLLMMCNYGKGKVFVLSTSLDEKYSDLTDHALFVPLMYKMALIGGNVSDLSYTLGEDKALNINEVYLEVDDRISMRTEDGTYEMLPLIERRNSQNCISFFEDLPSAGFYDVYKNDDYVKTVAWNDNRNESVMSFFNKEELKEMFKANNIKVLALIDYEKIDSDKVIGTLVEDSAIWKIFVIIALVALLIEILILRFWKN